MAKLAKRLLAATVVAVAAAMPVIAADKGDNNYLYRDYDALLGGVTAQLRDFMAANPGKYEADSLRSHVLETLTYGSVGKASQLTPARKKKLSADKLFELCRQSSLVFGKMDYTPQINADTAYSTASAVALTADGICATNFHVVFDIVMTGALDHKVSGDKMRFVMDYEGKAYPVTGVLAVDPVNDLAIIKVDPLGGKFVPASIGSDLRPGEKVYCLAHPNGTYYNFTEGMVSNSTRVVNKRNGQTRYNLEITAEYGSGASGGPIFDECGNLVSLVSTTLSLYAKPEKYIDFQMAYKHTVPVFLIKNRFND